MIKMIGLLSIVVLWAGLLFLVWFWKNKKHREMTFSQHAAQTRASQIYYFLLFALAMPPFVWFIISWFTPKFELPIWFNVLTVVASIFQAIAVSVPETTGWRVPVHRNAAFMMALCMPIALTFLLFTPALLMVPKFITAAAIIWQLIVIVLFIPNKGYHRRVQFLQVSYITVYHLAIIAAMLSV